MILPCSNYLFCARIVSGRRSGGGLCWRATCRGIAGRRLIKTMVRGAGSGRLPFYIESYIGWIDLPMPEKTHGRSHRLGRGTGVLLKLLRRPVAERRMEPNAIVVAVDEHRDISSQVIQVAILAGVNFFPFESLHKALTTGVVVRIGRPAHARNQAVLS